MEVKEKREQAWKYFDLHSRQRMQIFNYYIFIATAIIAGIGTFLGLSKIPTILVISLEVILIMLTTVFWFLDRRTRFLIKHSERCLIELEREESKILNLFDSERNMNSGIPSYTTSFKIMYSLFILLGVILIVYTLLYS